MKKFITVLSVLVLAMTACTSTANTEFTKQSVYDETVSILGHVNDLAKALGRNEVDKRAYDSLIDTLSNYYARLTELETIVYHIPKLTYKDTDFLNSRILGTKSEVNKVKSLIEEKKNYTQPVAKKAVQPSPSGVLVDIHSMNDAQLKSLMNKCEKVNWDANKLFQKYNILITSDDFETLQTVWTLQVLMDAL